MIVTIDGPAGAGKSSIARRLAISLGFEFLDTGAMYRAITLGAIREHISMDSPGELAAFAKTCQLRWENDRVYLNGEDVSEEIRTPTVTKAICHLADIPEVRHQLSTQQRLIAKGRDIVTEGRDQGTEVFPDAECKIFLTASSEERARRRQQQLVQQGKNLSIQEILDAQNQRDLEDKTREVGRLRAATDAVVLESDGMSSDQVLQKAIEIVSQCIACLAEKPS